VHITVVSHSSVRKPLLADVVAVAASLAQCDVCFLRSFLVRASLSKQVQCFGLEQDCLPASNFLVVIIAIMPWFYNKPSSALFGQQEFVVVVFGALSLEYLH
jgi:hypothetical protein